MSDPITKLIQLLDATTALDETQTMIDEARLVSPTDQYIQLELDRQQRVLDKKREFIRLVMFDIRSRN